MSRYATTHGPSVGVRWHKLPARRRGTEPRADHVNFLLLPWPLRIRASDFRPIEGSAQRDTDEPYGFFDFDPAERLDLDLVERMLVALLQNTQTRSDEAVQHKLNAIADGLSNLMRHVGQGDEQMEKDLRELRAAVGLENRESAS